MENQLDPIDKRIMNELTLDARIPFVKLATKLKVSNTLIHQRMKKMKALGIISNPTYRLKPAQLGYETSSYTSIMLENSKLIPAAEKELSKIPEIVECVNISGRYALLVKIYAKNNKHLRDIIYERIHTIEGVEGTNSTISFETAFIRNVPLVVE